MQRVADTTYLGEYIMQSAVGVADASLAAGDYYYIGQFIEGNMLRGFDWGNAQAKPITISFTAWANATYTLPLAVRNAANNRCWVGSFTVTTTRQRFTFTIPGDTTGTWLYDENIGLQLTIGLGIGSTFVGAAGWQAGNFLSMTGMTNFMATAANFIALKDFQLEVGSVATEFERVSYSDQLARCQRYYEVSNSTLGWSGNVTTGIAYNAWGTYKVTKRAPATVTATHNSNAGFPATPSIAVTESTGGIHTNRTANATTTGAYFSDSWTASAEL
jgi:hypothetical protein